jgi:hypothetical protein
MDDRYLDPEPHTETPPGQVAGGADVALEISRLPGFVNRLLNSAHEEERLIDELCRATLARDWKAAITLAGELAKLRDLAPKPAHAGETPLACKE